MRDKAPHIGRATSVGVAADARGFLEERLRRLHLPDDRRIGRRELHRRCFIEGSDVTDRVLGDRQQKLLAGRTEPPP